MNRANELDNWIMKIRAFSGICIADGVALCSYLKTSVNELIGCVEDPIYHDFEIKKKQGKSRLIQSPSNDLKQIQSRINDVLQLYYYVVKPQCVHGFVRNYEVQQQSVGIYTNAKAHVNKAFVLNVDIKDFFPTIKASEIKEKVFMDLFEFNDNVSSLLTALTTYEGHLPVGAPSSPVLSNLYCLSLDNRLTMLANAYDYSYTRYADDLTFSSNIKIAPAFISMLRQILNDFGFVINERKLRVKASHQQQTVTGLVVNSKVNVNRKYRKLVRAIKHDINKNGVEAAMKRNTRTVQFDQQAKNKYLRQVNGKLNFIDSIIKIK